MGRHLPEGVDLRLPDAVQLSNARQAVLRLRTVGCPYAGREHLIACVDVRRDLLATRNDGRPPSCCLAREIPGYSLAGTAKWNALWVWLYCVYWWLVQDAAKILAFRALITFDWFNYRSMTVVDGQHDPAHAARRAVATDDVEVPMIAKSRGRSGYGTL